MKERTKGKSKSLKLFKSGKAKTISMISLIVLAFTSLTIYVAANQSIKVSVTEAPDVDLVLTKGKTKTDLANFETDLKAELSKQNINPDKVKVQAISAQTVETQNSFTWQRDISSSIGSISLNETGNNVNMYGNPSNAGTNVMWIEPKDNEEQEFSMNYSINFGDSFNAAGMLLRVENDNGILKGYVLSFNNTSWRNSSGGNNGAIWEFQYVVGQHYFSKLQLVKGININTSGTLNVKATDTKIEILGGGITETVSIALPTIYGSGYGFFSDHYSHGCNNIGQFSLTNIKLDKTIIKDFNSVLQEPKWNDNTIRTIVHVQDSTRDEFAENTQVSDMLERMMNKGIYYIGWGTDANKTQMESTIQVNDNKGMYINNTEYQTAISETAKYIKSLMKSYKDTKTIIANEPYDLNISPSNIQSNTSDSDYPNGKWLVKQDTSKITNPDGQYEKSGQYQDTLTNDFKYPGEYTIFYEDQEVEKINVHRRPISSIKFTISQGQYNLDGTESYDPDHDDQANKGIKSYKWEYKKVSVGESNDWANISDQSTATWKAPTTDNYLIRLVVTDADGAESIPTIKHVTGVSSDESTLKPIADFTIKDAKFYYGNKLEVVDNSYDPAGLEIKSRTWKIVKNGSVDVYEGETPVLDYNPETNKTIDSNKIGVGKYSISLKVTNSKGTTSDEFIGDFEVTDDVTAPTVTATPDNDEKTNEAINVKLKFEDKESGVEGYKYQITNSPAKIESTDANYKEGTLDQNKEAIIKINNVEEDQYLHVISFDKAGNSSEDRVIGKFFIHSKYTIKIQATNNNLGIQGVTFNVEGQYQNGEAINLGRFNAKTDNNGIITIPDVPLKNGQNGLIITPIITPEGVSLIGENEYKYVMLLLDDDLKLKEDSTTTSEGLTVNITNTPVEEKNAFINIPFNKEKTSILVYNVDNENEDNYLNGASYELRNPTTREILDTATIVNGKAKLSFDMPTGSGSSTYLLSQTSEIVGYDTLSGDISVKISYEDGRITAITPTMPSNSKINAAVETSPWGLKLKYSRNVEVEYKNNITVKVKAVDSKAKTSPISGVKYSLYVKQTDSKKGDLQYQVNNVETDSNGYATFSGLYAIKSNSNSVNITIKREDTPSKYYKEDKTITKAFSVNENGEIIDQENEFKDDVIEIQDELTKKDTKHIFRFKVVDKNNPDIGVVGLKYQVQNYAGKAIVDKETDTKGEIVIDPFETNGSGDVIYRIQPNDNTQFGLKLEKILMVLSFDEAGTMKQVGTTSSQDKVSTSLVEETTDVSINEVAEVIYKVDMPNIEGKNSLNINLKNKENNTPIQGSAYNLLFTTKEGYQVSKIVTTDANGVATTKVPDTDYLKIQILETKAAAGYRRDTEEKAIVVENKDGKLVKSESDNKDTSLDWAITENNEINVNLTNDLATTITANVKIHLTDKNGNVSIQGATYKITNIGTNESSEELTTNNYGEIEYNSLKFEGAGCYNILFNQTSTSNSYVVPSEKNQYKIQFRIVKENGVIKYKDYTILSGTSCQFAKPTINYNEQDNSVSVDVYLLNNINNGQEANNYYSIDIDRVDKNGNLISTDVNGNNNAKYNVNFIPSNSSTDNIVSPITVKTDVEHKQDSEVEISHIEKYKDKFYIMLQQTSAESGVDVDNSPIIIPVKYNAETGEILINNDAGVISSINDPVYENYLTSTDGGVFAKIDNNPSIQGNSEQVLHILIKEKIKTQTDTKPDKPDTKPDEPDTKKYSVKIRLFNKQRGNSNWQNGKAGINEDYYAELGSTNAGSRTGRQLTDEEQYALAFREDALIDGSGYKFMKQNDGSQNKTICKTYLIDENGNVSNDVYEEVSSETNAIQNDVYGTDSIYLQKDYKNKTVKFELYEDHVIYDYRKSDKTQEFILEFDENGNVKSSKDKDKNKGNLKSSEVVIPGVNTDYSGNSNLKYSYNYNSQYFYYRYVSKAKQTADNYDYVETNRVYNRFSTHYYGALFDNSLYNSTWKPQYYYLDGNGNKNYVKDTITKDDSWTVHSSTGDEYEDKTIGENEWHINNSRVASLNDYKKMTSVVNPVYSYLGWNTYDYYDGIYGNVKSSQKNGAIYADAVWINGFSGILHVSRYATHFDGTNNSLQQTDKAETSKKYYASDYSYNQDGTLRASNQIQSAIVEEAKKAYNDLANNNQDANVDWHPFYQVNNWEEKSVDLSTDEYNCIGKNTICVGWLHDKADKKTNIEVNVNDRDTNEGIKNARFMLTINKDNNDTEPVEQKIMNNANYPSMVTTDENGKSKLVMEHNFVDRTMNYSLEVSNAGYVEDSNCDNGKRTYTESDIPVINFKVSYNSDGYITDVQKQNQSDNSFVIVDDVKDIGNANIAIIKTTSNSLSIYIKEKAENNFELKINKKDEKGNPIKGVCFEALVQNASTDTTDSTQSLVNYHTNSSAETDENGNVTIGINLKGSVAAYNNKNIKIVLTETQSVNGYDSISKAEIQVPFKNGIVDDSNIVYKDDHIKSVNGISGDNKIGLQVNLINKNVNATTFKLHTIDADTKDETNNPINLSDALYEIKVYKGGTEYHNDPVQNHTLLSDTTTEPIQKSDDNGITTFTMDTTHSYADRADREYNLNDNKDKKSMMLNDKEYKNTIIYEIVQKDTKAKYTVNDPMLVEVLYDRDGKVYNTQILSNQTFATPYGRQSAIDISKDFDPSGRNIIELTIRNEQAPAFKLDLTKVDTKNNNSPMSGAIFNVKSYVKKDDNTYDFSQVDESVNTTDTTSQGFIYAGFKKDNSGKTVLYEVTEVKRTIDATTAEDIYFNDTLRGYVEITFNNYGEISNYKIVKKIGENITELNSTEYNKGDNYISVFNQNNLQEGKGQTALGIKVSVSTFKIGMFLYSPNNTIYSKAGLKYNIKTELYKQGSNTLERECNYITSPSNNNGIIENTIGEANATSNTTDENIRGEVLRGRTEKITISTVKDAQLKDYLPTNDIEIVVSFDQNGNYMLTPSNDVSGLFEYGNTRLTTSKINQNEKNNLELNIPLYERDRQTISFKLVDDIDQSVITNVNNAYELESDVTPNGTIDKKSISIDNNGNAVVDLGPNYGWENTIVSYILRQKQTDENHVINYWGTDGYAKINVSYDENGKIASTQISKVGGLDECKLSVDQKSYGTNEIICNDINRRKTSVKIHNESSTSGNNIEGATFQISTVDTGVSKTVSKYRDNGSYYNDTNKPVDTPVTADNKTIITDTSISASSNLLQLNYKDGLDNDLSRETDLNGDLTLNPGPHFTATDNNQAKEVRYILKQKTKTVSQMTQTEFEAYEGYKQLPEEGIEFKITWDNNGNFVSGDIADCPDTTNDALVAEYNKYKSDKLIEFKGDKNNKYNFEITLKSIPKITVGIATKNSTTDKNISNGRYHIALYSEDGTQIEKSDVFKTYDNAIAHGGINSPINTNYKETQNAYLLVYEDQAPTGYQYIYQRMADTTNSNITSGLIAVYRFTLDTNENITSELQPVTTPITALGIDQDTVNKLVVYSSKITIDNSAVGNSHKDTAHDVHLNIKYDKNKEFLVHVENIRGDTSEGLNNIKFDLTYENGQTGKTITGTTDSKGTIQVEDGDSNADCFNLGVLNTNSTLKLKLHQNYSNVQTIDPVLGELHDVGLSIGLNKDGGVDVGTDGKIQNITVLKDGTYLLINGDACKITRGASEYEINITIINSPKLTFIISNQLIGSNTKLESEINVIEDDINISTNATTQKPLIIPNTEEAYAEQQITPKPNSEVRYEIDQTKILNAKGSYQLSQPIRFKIKYDKDGSIENITSDDFRIISNTNSKNEIVRYQNENTNELLLKWDIQQKYIINITIMNKENFNVNVKLVDIFGNKLNNFNSNYTVDVKEILTSQGTSSKNKYDSYRTIDQSLNTNIVSSDAQDLSYTFNNDNNGKNDEQGISEDTGKLSRTNYTPSSQTIKNYSYYYVRVNDDNLLKATDNGYTKKLSENLGDNTIYPSGTSYDARIKVYFDEKNNPVIGENAISYKTAMNGYFVNADNRLLNISAETISGTKNVVITIKVAPKLTINVTREDGITGKKLAYRDIQINKIANTSENANRINSNQGYTNVNLGQYSTGINGTTADINGTDTTIQRTLWNNTNIGKDVHMKPSDSIFEISDVTDDNNNARTKISNKRVYVTYDAKGNVENVDFDNPDIDIMSYTKIDNRKINITIKDVKMVNFVVHNIDYMDKSTDASNTLFGKTNLYENFRFTNNRTNNKVEVSTQETSTNPLPMVSIGATVSDSIISYTLEQTTSNKKGYEKIPELQFKVKYDNNGNIDSAQAVNDKDGNLKFVIEPNSTTMHIYIYSEPLLIVKLHAEDKYSKSQNAKGINGLRFLVERLDEEGNISYQNGSSMLSTSDVETKAYNSEDGDIFIPVKYADVIKNNNYENTKMKFKIVSNPKSESEQETEGSSYESISPIEFEVTFHGTTGNIITDTSIAPYPAQVGTNSSNLEEISVYKASTINHSSDTGIVHAENLGNETNFREIDVNLKMSRKIGIGFIVTNDSSSSINDIKFSIEEKVDDNTTTYNTNNGLDKGETYKYMSDTKNVANKEVTYVIKETTNGNNLGHRRIEPIELIVKYDNDGKIISSKSISQGGARVKAEINTSTSSEYLKLPNSSKEVNLIVKIQLIDGVILRVVNNDIQKDSNGNLIPIQGSKFNVAISNTTNLNGENTYTTNKNGMIEIENLKNNGGDITLTINQTAEAEGYSSNANNKNSVIKFAINKDTKDITISNPLSNWINYKEESDPNTIIYSVVDNDGNKTKCLTYNNDTGVIELYYYNETKLSLNLQALDYKDAHSMPKKETKVLGAQYNVSYQVADNIEKIGSSEAVNLGVASDTTDVDDGSAKIDIINTHKFDNKTVLFTLENTTAPYVMDNNKREEYLKLTDTVTFYVTFNDKGQVVDSYGFTSGDTSSNIITIYKNNGDSNFVNRIDSKEIHNNNIDLTLLYAKNEIDVVAGKYSLSIYNLDDKTPANGVKSNGNNKNQYNIKFEQQDENGNYNQIGEQNGIVDDSGVLTINDLLYTGDIQVTVTQEATGENNYAATNKVGIFRYHTISQSNHNIDIAIDNKFNDTEKENTNDKYLKYHDNNGNTYVNNEGMTVNADTMMNVINVKVYNIQVISVKFSEISSDGKPIKYERESDKLEFAFTFANENKSYQTTTDENGEISFDIKKTPNAQSNIIQIAQTHRKGILDNNGNITLEFDSATGKILNVESSDTEIFQVEHTDYGITIKSIQRDNLNETYNVKLNLYKKDVRDEILLPNAVFQLSVKKSGTPLYRVLKTDENGLASVDIPIVQNAEYELTEQISPDGYITDEIVKYKFDISLDAYGNVTVDKNSLLNIDENNISTGATSDGEGLVELTIPNDASGSKIIVQNIQRPNENDKSIINIKGSTFEITDVENNKKFTTISDNNGYAKVILPKVTDTTKEYQYKIKQTKVADGYTKDSDERIINIKYNSDGTINNVSINRNYEAPTIGEGKDSAIVKFENDIDTKNYPKFYIQVINTDNTKRSLPIQGTKYRIELNDTKTENGITDIDGKYKTSEMSYKGDFTIKVTETDIQSNYTRNADSFVIKGNIDAGGNVNITDKGNVECNYDASERTFKIHITNKLLENLVVFKINKCYIDDNNQLHKITNNVTKLNVKIGNSDEKVVTTNLEDGGYVSSPISTINLNDLQISISEIQNPTGYEKNNGTAEANVEFMKNETGESIVKNVDTNPTNILQVGQTTDNFVELNYINLKTNNAVIIPGEDLYLKSKDDIYPITSDLKYMFKIQPYTTIENFIKDLQSNGNIKIYDINNNEVSGAKLVGTGMKVIATKDDKSISYTLIVRGDCDGDGEIHAKDRNDIQNLILGIDVRSKIPKELVEKAADVNYDGGIHAKDRNMVQYVILHNDKFEDHEDK